MNFYAHWLEQIDAAEDLGFDSLWVTEHHFRYFGGMLPNPQLLLAAAARKNRRPCAYRAGVSFRRPEPCESAPVDGALRPSGHAPAARSYTEFRIQESETGLESPLPSELPDSEFWLVHSELTCLCCV